MNDDSIVLKLTYKNISFLFTGDITQNVEKELLQSTICNIHPNILMYQVFQV